MKIFCHFLLVLCTITSSNAKILVNRGRIVFNESDEFPLHCKLPNNDMDGVCTNIRFCPTVLKSREQPTKCYFIGFEYYVCCPVELQPDKPIKNFNKRNGTEEASNLRRRPADEACIRNYSPITKLKSTVPDDELPRTLSHGIPSELNEFPFMCALGWVAFTNNSDFNIFSLRLNPVDFKCGGVLIAPKFILTAAHCAYVKGVAPSVVLPGGFNLTEFGVRYYEIARVKMHPEYKPQFNYHDVALIETTDTIDTNWVCLWSKNIMSNIKVTVIGYGAIKFSGPSSTQLLKGELSTIGNEECRQYFETDFKMVDGIISKQLCAKDPAELTDTCVGDSGGPMILHQQEHIESGRPLVVGITSFGPPCAHGAPGVYTRISEYLEWIERIVWPN